MKPIGKSIEPLTRPIFTKRGFAEGRILTHWEQIVGPELARASLPQKLSFPANRKTDGALQIQVESGRALEIQYQEPQILERINTYFGYRAVGRLTLLQAPLPRTEKPAPMHKGALPPARKEALNNLLASVKDDELKEALTSLGEAMLVKNSSLDKPRS